MTGPTASISGSDTDGADRVIDADFAARIFGTLTEHIVVVDRAGAIVFHNRAWNRFADENGYHRKSSWYGINYLTVCDKAASKGDADAAEAVAGIRQVMAGQTRDFYMEYPCHSPDTQRWYMMRVTPFTHHSEPYFVISHQDITERKAAEMTAMELAHSDALTGLANRRRFEELFDSEWRRCQRQGLPIILALIDVDFFKELNDLQGHPAGDKCLQAVAEVLSDFARRPGDFCARVGGDEFAVVLSGVAPAEGFARLRQLPAAVRALAIANTAPEVGEVVTISVGAAGTVPRPGDVGDDLIANADEMLYRAKGEGRDRLASIDTSPDSGLHGVVCKE